MQENKKLLLVEDDRDFSESLRLLLQIKGYSVTLAASGEEAVALYPQDVYCCVLMDIKLPGISGVETLERILEEFPDANVLLMTGCDRGAEEVVSANLAGASGVLFKPFKVSDLLSSIDKLH